jgi:hypothetical protein
MDEAVVPQVAQPEEKVEKTDAKLLKRIEQQIKAGIKWQEKGHYAGADARKEQWKRNAKMLRCIWDDSWTNSKFDAFNVNTIYSLYNTIRPTLYFKNPKISAVPSKPNFTRDMYGNVIKDESGKPKMSDNYKTGRLFSTKINYELREIGFKNALKRIVGDNLCPYGVGWIKWGWKDSSYGGHSNERDRKTSFWCARIDPRNVVYNYAATNIDDCKLIAERLILTREEAEEFGMEIPEGIVSSEPEFLKDRNSDVKKNTDTSDELIIVWEVHDLKHKKLMWLLLEADKSPVEVKPTVDYPYPFDGPAIHPCVLDDDNDDIIGMSIVEPIEEQAKALNRMRSMEVRQIENYGPGMIREESTATADEIKAFNRTPFGWDLVVKDGHINKIQMVSPLSIGADHYNLSETHKDEIRTTVGVTDYQQGGAQSRTATEGNIIQNAANVRISEKRDIIHDFVIQCVRRLAGMIQMFSEDEEYINLRNEEMGEDYIEYLKENFDYDPSIPFLRMSKQDIQGEYNFEFNVEEMIERPREVQLQQWINTLQVVGSNPMLMEAANNVGLSMEKVLQKVFELGGLDIDEVKKGGPVQMSAEQENQMFMAGMEVPEPHAKDKNDEHILAHKRPLMEIEQQLQMVQQQVLQMQQQNQAMMTAQDPAMIDPNVAAQNEQAIQEMILQAEPLQDIARRIKLHIQWHDMSRQQKDKMKMGGGQSGPMPQGQPAASQQTQIQAGAVQ